MYLLLMFDRCSSWHIQDQCKETAKWILGSFVKQCSKHKTVYYLPRCISVAYIPNDEHTFQLKSNQMSYKYHFIIWLFTH